MAIQTMILEGSCLVPPKMTRFVGSLLAVVVLLLM